MKFRRFYACPSCGSPPGVDRFHCCRTYSDHVWAFLASVLALLLCLAGIAVLIAAIATLASCDGDPLSDPPTDDASVFSPRTDGAPPIIRPDPPLPDASPPDARPLVCAVHENPCHCPTWDGGPDWGCSDGGTP